MLGYKKFLGYLSVFLLVSLFIWQWIQHRQPLPRFLDKDTLAQTTNMSIYNLEYRQFNAEGEMIHFLETPLLQHIPDHDTHLLTMPHIIITEQNQAPWDISAQQAKATEGGKEIAFSENVRIKQQTEKQGEILLSTEHLLYIPAQKKATTQDEVTMTQAHNQIQSKGLIADLEKNSIHLLQNARGHYVQDKT